MTVKMSHEQIEQIQAAILSGDKDTALAIIQSALDVNVKR